MSKLHYYDDAAPRCVDCSETIEPFEIEGKRQKMLERCLESIEDLLQEVATGGSVISIQQRDEMENIIKDARVQGL